jgi:hypothetical protein
MSLKKRHIGRRVAGVGVGVALMVLGLQAPAMAAPAVASFTPTTGPTNCVIVLTGTGFTDVPQIAQDVVFVGPVAGTSDDITLDGDDTDEADYFARISATEMWVQVPDPGDLGAVFELQLGVSYNIQVNDSSGTGTVSPGTFTRVTGSGGCAPTITSITPTCGGTDDTVKVAGTNLIGPGLVGGETRFSPYVKIAAHVVPDVDVPTSISVVVPSASTDGKLQVTTFDTDSVATGVQGGIAFSPTVFDISDACAPVTGNEHARSITFKIKKSGAASGVVSSTEDPAFTDCAAAVPVKIQRKTSGGWKTVGKTTTTDEGSYSKKVKNKSGKQKFRALAPKVSLGDPVTDVCLKEKSATRTA